MSGISKYSICGYSQETTEEIYKGLAGEQDEAADSRSPICFRIEIQIQRRAINLIHEI